MDKKQVEKLILRVIGIGVIITMIYFVHFLAKEHMPQVLQYMFPAILILAVIGFAIYFAHQKKQRLKNDPLHKKDSLYEFTQLLWPLTIFVVAITVSNLFEEAEEQSDPMFCLAIIFLTGLMWSVLKIFKQQQKRIEALEDKLNEQNQTKD